MILGIGIDTIEIDRFAHWHTYSDAQLQRIFSPAEIRYCLQTKTKSAERFAVRFAVREALWKALCQASPEHTIPFLTLCRTVEIAHTSRGVPYFKINQNRISIKGSVHVSLSHTKTIATGMVVISRL